MWQILRLLKKNLVWSIPGAMLLGLIYGYFFDSVWLKKAVVPLTVLMIYPMMATIEIKEVFSKCSYKFQIVTQVVNFIIIPLAGVVIGKIFLRDYPIIAFGLLLIAVLPTSGMTISWTGFAKGNMHMAVKMSIIGLIVGPLILPLYAKLFMGQVVATPLVKIFKQIGIIVFIPMILGYLTKVFLIKKYGKNKFDSDMKVKFPLLAPVGVVGIIFVIMTLKAKLIIHNPQLVLVSLLPLLIFYGFNYLLVTIIAKKLFTREDSIALVYGTVMRNLSVALAVTLAVFGKEGTQVALIVAIAYLIQVKSAAWYGKFANKILGAVKSQGFDEEFMRDEGREQELVLQK